MAVNFGLLQPINAVSAFYQGQQAAQQQAEQNRLREMQMMQMEAQRENALALREQRQMAVQERQAKMAQAAQRQDFLTRLGAKMAEGGHKLDRPTLGSVLQFGMQSGEDSLIKLATEGLRALDEEDLYQQEQSRLSTAPGAAVTREQVQNMLLSPSARVREQGKALAATLPKEPAPRASTLMTPEEEAQRIRIARESRPPAQPREPREPSAPVAVVDEATGRVKYVTREEAIGKTPAKEMEGLAPKEVQRREAVFPQAKQSVTTVTNTMTTIEQTIDRLLKNKDGLNGVTGLVYGRTPALTDAARRADADLEQLANLAFVQGITELRAASKTGAGVGNVSNKEGDRFENLKASLKRTQSYDDMVAALTRLKAQASSTKNTVNTEFTDMYEYRQGRAAPPPPAPGAGGGNFPPPPPAAIDALKRGQGTDAEFDAIFGPGAAARARGR